MSEYDVIVIGSGLGGLACASLLTKLGGKRVLVLERHFKPGVATPVPPFTAAGFRTDSGLLVPLAVGAAAAAGACVDFATSTPSGGTTRNSPPL